ncbi:MAG TPA: hypothetical protein VEB69_09215 [Acidimicrobiia bacterium]|nr:hypothetical protein [Acidimicrobiia bacterium]
MIRRMALGAMVVGAVTIGLVAQTANFMLALSSPGIEAEQDPDHRLPLAERGIHEVGVRDLARAESRIPMKMWYPAIADPRKSATTYSYGLHVMGPGTSTALATFSGHARHGLAPDIDGGPYPLVVLSHGFAISASSYGWLAEQIASHGFVVVAPHHEETLDPRLLWRSTVERPADIETTLDVVERGSLDGADMNGLVDTGAVAVVGHSYGGYTALAAGGAHLDLEAFRDSCDSAGGPGDRLAFLCGALLPNLERISQVGSPGSSVDAIVSIAGDAAMFGESGVAVVEVPLLVIGGTADIDAPFEWGTELAYDHVSSTRKIEVTLEGAGHMVFAGKCESVRRVLSLAPMGFCSDPGWDGGEAKEVVGHYVTAFLLSELLGDDDATSHLGRSGPGIAELAVRSEGY